MKLIFKHEYIGDDGDTYTHFIPFEYESKIKFLQFLWKKFDKEYWKKRKTYCVIFFCTTSFERFKEVDKYILTVDEWFEQEKEIIEHIFNN
jgi:hypothetical protein